MGKSRKPSTAVERASKANRQANRDAYVAGLRDGRITGRPATFADRRKAANRNACRNRADWSN